MKNLVVVIGAGCIGQAVARRVSAGKHVVLADLRADNADAAARTDGGVTAAYWFGALAPPWRRRVYRSAIGEPCTDSSSFLAYSSPQ